MTCLLDGASRSGGMTILGMTDRGLQQLTVSISQCRRGCSVILEQAIFAITPGSEADFEAAMGAAKEVIAEAKGFRSLTLRRCIERPSSYLLLNEWDTVEDHIVGFRGSELFVRWRELIGPYFAAAPEVEHFESPAVTG